MTRGGGGKEFSRIFAGEYGLKTGGIVMSTLSLSAELFRELSYLADDEGCMRSLVAYARRLVARRREEDEAREGMAVAEEGEAYRPLTREEMAAEVEEMCRVLADFVQIAQGYRADECRAYATSAWAYDAMAWACGAGLVTVACDPLNVTALHTQLPEAMVIDFHDQAALTNLVAQVDTVVIGPGVGTEAASLAVLHTVFAQS